MSVEPFGHQPPERAVLTTRRHCPQGSIISLRRVRALIRWRAHSGLETRAMALNHVTLETSTISAAAFVTWFQALVRLCMMQKERDRRIQHPGCDGLPRLSAGTLDQQFIRAQRQLDRYDIDSGRHQRGHRRHRAVGSQQRSCAEGKFDGVFALVRKGPGVDRTGDAFVTPISLAPPNMACAHGRRPHGRSSTTAHNPSIIHRRDDPILNPAGCRRSWITASTAGRCRVRAPGSRSSMRDGRSTAVIDGSLET